MKIGRAINLSTDIDLIIECCRSSQNIQKLQKLILGIENWEKFIDLAYTHGIFPLVYHTLKLYTQLIPNHILQTMQSYNMDIAKKNMLLSSELIHLTQKLQQNDIDVLSFKGPILSEIIFKNITQRQFLDLDIFISKFQIYTAAKLLTEMGYIPMESIEFLKNEAKLQEEKNYEFFHPKKHTKVELHWKLLNNPLLGNFIEYDVWKNALSLKLFNTELKTLDFEFQILYLCSHGTAHMWERVEWIVDIDRFLRKSSLDWERLFHLSSELQSTQTLLLGLYLSHTMFNTPLPDFVTQKIQKEKHYLENLQKSILSAMQLSESKKLTDTEDNRLLFQFFLQLEKNPLKKTLFILKTVFKYSNHDIMTVNLPKKLYFLYYFIRIYRLSKKYIFKK